jgi:hypothetical protein
MPASVRKVQSRDPLKIPAATFNTLVDAATDCLQRQQGREQTSFPARRHSGIVLARNDSGASRKRFEILGVDSIVIGLGDSLDELKRHSAFRGVTPATDDESGGNPKGLPDSG